MILKLKFIFITDGILINRNYARRTARLALVWAILLVPIAAVPAALGAGASRLRPRADCGSRVADAADPADPPSPPSDAGTEAIFPHFKSTRFWVSGQTNFIFQALPGFHAAYSGPHSLLVPTTRKPLRG